MADIPLLDDAAAAVVPLHAFGAQQWPDALQGLPAKVRALAALHDFAAQAGRLLLVPGDGGLERVFFGLGGAPSPMLFGELGRALPPGDYTLADRPPEMSSTSAATAFALGAYAFTRYKPRPRPAPRLAAPGADLVEARAVATAVYLARDLVNTPANDMGPSQLQAAAEAVARQGGATCETVVGDALLAHNYPLIHAVGRAAADSPRFVRLCWGPPDAPRIAVIGKGVTFDSGGLDIKPDTGMRLMKKDMGGAAIALALSQLVMAAGLKVRLETYLPIVENAIGAGAFRPGDVVPSRAGLSVEVDNTDAEGRLILADALSRAGEDSPELLLCFATLTGAARVALGPDVTPFYTADDTLAAELASAGDRVGDPLWRMPLWDGYARDLDSPIADLKNTGDGGMAGSIYAALFLKKFITAKAFAHFDVYAWSPKDKPGRPAGGDAQALRAAWSVLRTRYGSA